MERTRSNAERQQAYRDRKRNAKRSIVTPIVANPRNVNADPRFNNPNYQWICKIEGRDVFASVSYGGKTYEEYLAFLEEQSRSASGKNVGESKEGGQP